MLFPVPPLRMSSVAQVIGEQRMELFHKTADQWMKEM
jgi:hypothetical protein